MTEHLWAPLAWLGPELGFGTDVLVSCSPAGSITSVQPGKPLASCPPGAVRMGGDVCLPGFVNAHSHAFHRALRGVTETSSGSFWTWRQLMYSVAEAIDPDSYRELASFVYAEMLLAGYTAVGEFHYLHHDAGGVPYTDPNEMGRSLLAAAASAGIRLTLIDACYLQAGIDGAPLSGVQLRFGDGSGERWAERVSRLLPPEDPLLDDPAGFGGAGFGVAGFGVAGFGVAVHSVRATPARAIRTVAALAASRSLPLHVHLSEQRRENEECLKVAGVTPTDLLRDCEAVSARTTAVHATHVTATDMSRLGLAGCGVCACPTTERDLGDGIGPFPELSEAGAVLSIGSDSHAVIDPFEETRAVELDERLSSERRGAFRVSELLAAGTSGGCRALGLPADGIAPGGLADLVGIRLDSPRLAGGRLAGVAEDDESLLARVLFAASPADVDTVVVGGQVVVWGGEHVRFGPPAAVGERLGKAIGSVL